MTWKKLLEQAQKKAAAAKALLEGDKPNVEEAKTLLAEAEALRDQAKALKAAGEIEADADAQIKAFDKAAKEPATNSGLAVTKDARDNQAENPELPAYKFLGEQLMDVYKAGRDGRNPSPRLIKAHKATAKAISGASETVPPDGGFLVQTDFAGTLIKPEIGGDSILGRVRRITLSGEANSTKLNGIDETSRATGSRWGGIRGYWLAEGDQFTSSKPKFREIRLEVHKVGALCYATDEVLADTSQLETVIGQGAREELIFLAENAVINGTGSGQPLGLTAGSSCRISVAKETGQGADTIVTENIIKMWARRWVRGSYVWLVNQQVEQQLQQMSMSIGTGGQLVYMPPGGLTAAPYGVLFGAPVIPTEFCAALGDVNDIILAALDQYLYCDKGNVQEAVSIHLRFDYDESVFRFIYRVDGQPSWSSALTPFAAGSTTPATVSPFVVLAARA